MKWGAFVKTWEGALEENKWNRVFNGALIAVVMGLLFLVFTKDRIVVVQPETLGSEAWLTKSDASESYKEAWGLFLAQLTGNITPENVGFIRERIKPLLSPAIYSDVIETLDMQIDNIRNDRITIRFEPRMIEYEKTTDKVYVYGYSFVKGATGTEEKSDRTYEYRIRISNYAPMILDLDTYEGMPRTEDVLLEMQNRENRSGDDA